MGDRLELIVPHCDPAVNEYDQSSTAPARTAWKSSGRSPRADTRSSRSAEAFALRSESRTRPTNTLERDGFSRAPPYGFLSCENPCAGRESGVMSPQPYRLHVQPPDDDAAEGRMGFLEHLDELRTRIIRSCIAIGVGMVVAFAFYDQLADIVLDPITRSLPAGTALVFIRPGEGFAFYLNISLIAGFLLAAPFVMHQVWRFIAPGLYANEKRFLIPFVVLTSGGSVGGALFSQYVLFPGLMKFYGRSTRRA